MRYLHKTLLIIAVSLLLIITVPCFAYAYLDPGTGSYILQILIAAFFGTLYALKRYWHQIKFYLSGLLIRSKSGKNDE
jgi:hypothetical protein